MLGGGADRRRSASSGRRPVALIDVRRPATCSEGADFRRPAASVGCAIADVNSGRRPGTSEESNLRAAAQTGDFGVSGHFWGVLGRGTGRKRFGSTVGFIWSDSQDLATILDPFRTIFANLGPDRVSET